MELKLLSGKLSICRLDPREAIPGWATAGEFFTVSRTAEELSVTCEADRVPEGVRAEGGWRCLKVVGPLEFSLTGVLASLVQPLAERKISVFAISTFDTDYLLIKDSNLEAAIAALKACGHCLRE